jgi:hypothetical protein
MSLKVKTSEHKIKQKILEQKKTSKGKYQVTEIEKYQN